MPPRTLSREFTALACLVPFSCCDNVNLLLNVRHHQKIALFEDHGVSDATIDEMLARERAVHRRCTPTRLLLSDRQRANRQKCACFLAHLVFAAIIPHHSAGLSPSTPGLRAHVVREWRERHSHHRYSSGCCSLHVHQNGSWVDTCRGTLTHFQCCSVTLHKSLPEASITMLQRCTHSGHSSRFLVQSSKPQCQQPEVIFFGHCFSRWEDILLQLTPSAPTPQGVKVEPLPDSSPLPSGSA